MANPPPPYADITGISRTVMKDNAQETLANYNGNARPGEIVADLTTDPPALYIGNNAGQLTALASGGGGYGNTQVAQYLAAGVVGNIIPAGNNINSLGNATNQWNGLYISNTTIYMNSVPISLGPGNVLTVDGNEILSNGSDATVSTTGNVTANYFIGDGSQLTNISTFGNFISNGDSRVTIDTPNGNIDIYANMTPWSFETSGTLRLPIGEIGYAFGPGPTIISNVDTGAAFSVLCTSSGANGPLAVMGTVSFDGNTGVGITQVQDEFGNVDAWLFNPGGNLVIPGNIIGNSNQAFWAYSDTGLTVTSNVQNDINGVSMEDGVDTLAYANANVVIQTNIGNVGNIYVWTFGNDGNLNLPSEGTIVGVTPNNTGYLQWVGNSSGDGGGYTTLRLVPDTTVENADQYLIVDPTAPGHIHIRAGGIQDDSAADLIFGGENSHVKITGGLNPPVYVTANSQNWLFGIDGVLQTPGDISASGNLISTTTRTAPIVFANLVPVSGARAFMADANLVAAGNFGANVSGGGSNTVPVWSDGTNWYIG